MADETQISGDPESIDISSIPNYIAIPNMRFGAGYLDTKYRDKAMRYEVMHDRITGETLFRRGLDGKFVSFYQNFKYIHDLVMEYTILESTASSLRKPDDSYYININYDTDLMFGNIHYDIIERPAANFNTDTIGNINNGIVIPVGKNNNGFFFRPLVRDVDRPVVDFLSTVYDNYYMNYSGTDSASIERRTRYLTYPFWKNRNSWIHYTVRGYYEANMYYDTGLYTSGFIRVGESVYINIDAPINELSSRITTGQSYLYYEVFVTRINFEKIPEAIKLINNGYVSENVQNTYNNLLAPDGTIQLRLCNAISFIDDDTVVKNTTTKEFIAMLSVPFLTYYMGNVSAIASNNCYIISEDRPDDTKWRPVGLWGEIVREVGEGSDVTDINTAVYDDLIEYLTPNTITELLFTQTASDKDDILLRNLGENLDMVSTNFTRDDTREDDILLDEPEDTP